MGVRMIRMKRIFGKIPMDFAAMTCSTGEGRPVMLWPAV